MLTLFSLSGDLCLVSILDESFDGDLEGDF